MKLINKYNNDKTLIALFIDSVKSYNNKTIYRYKKREGNYTDISYSDFYSKVKKFAAGLKNIGLLSKKMIIISDNCPEWMIAVIANMGTGGIDIPRGINCPDKELEYIINFCDADFICLQNKESYEKIRRININRPVPLIIFDDYGVDLPENMNTFEGFCRNGEEYLIKNGDFFEEAVNERNPNDVGTIIFTSGTTGTPKGVMLTHNNLKYAPAGVPGLITAYDTDKWMSILPIWHIGERFFEFMGIINGVTIILSSIYSMRDDMKNEKPQLIPGVPLVWKRIMDAIIKGFKDKKKDKLLFFFYNKSLKYINSKRILTNKIAKTVKTGIFEYLEAFISILTLSFFHLIGKSLIYSKILEATGGEVRTITSGGGKLTKEAEDFFEVIGLKIIDGYGSTETATLVTIREENYVKYTIGKIMEGVEYEIRHPETNLLVAANESGVLLVKGPQIFKGYYKNPEATKKVLSEDGWYNTGDLVKQTITGDLVFVGRVKETIVLSNGENVEPEPIEQMLENSELVKHAVVFGQDMPHLTCLIIPDFDNLKSIIKKYSLEKLSIIEIINNNEIVSEFKKEIKSFVNLKKGFLNHELIKDFYLSECDFEVGVELTNTMKKKRKVIEAKYGEIISNLYNKK